MKKLLIDLLALTIVSTSFAGEVFLGLDYHTYVGEHLLDTSIVNNLPSFKWALKTAMYKCELKYSDCKFLDRETKKWYNGQSNHTYEATAISVYGSKKTIDVEIN